MKYTLRLGIGVCLICSALVTAQTNSGSPTEPKQASDSNTRESNQPPLSTLRLPGVDILSDTTDVDLGPYLQPVLKSVKQNWYNLSPPIARAPRMMRGEVTIEFAILRTGKVTGMKLVENSGDVSLDRAAWGAIFYSRFSPLPAEYPGQYLALRFHFLYNPAKPSDVILQYKERTRP